MANHLTPDELSRIGAILAPETVAGGRAWSAPEARAG